MKFGDILGEAMLSDDYRKVSRKVKLMYKTIRAGGIKIGKLIPDMVPFFTGFEMVDDKDALITYELPTTYHLESGHEIYNLIITGITINCEKYPGLADDIDIREDLLRRLAHRINNALIGSFNEGQQIKFQIRRKSNLPSYGFENVLDESVDNEQERVIKKAKLIYKTFRKGNVKVKFPPIFNDGKEMDIVAKYELPTKFKIKIDFNHIFNRPITFYIPIEDVKLEFDYVAKYESIKEELKEQILHKIKMKFIRFDSNCEMIFTKYKDAFKDVESHVVKEEEDKYNHLTKKIPTIYKALRKGTIELTIHQFDYDTIRRQDEKQVKFNYELPNLYKIRTDNYSNNYPVSILIPEIKIDCPEEPELAKQSIKHKILDKLRKKFNHFDLTLFIRPTEFFLKNNGTWTNL
jgi:hypothetical protein